MNITRLISNSLICAVVVALAACSNDGEIAQTPQQGSVQTAPEISNLKLTPAAGFVAQGNGSLTVEATVDYYDPDLDLTTVRIVISDGTDLTITIEHAIDTAQGTLPCPFDISTAQEGSLQVEFWLLDSAGSSSNHLTANFEVLAASNGGWTGHLAGLPFVLNDVLWDSVRFIAVGDGGVILTSPDGINWTERESGTDVDLYAIGFDLYDHVVVGDGATVLASSDGAASWSVQHSGLDNISLRAVVHTAWPIIAGGKDTNAGAAVMLRSPDHGQSWSVVEIPQSGRSVSGLAGSVGNYVAATEIEARPNDGRIWVSLDGIEWTEVVVSEQDISTYSVVYDFSQFVVGGSNGRLYRSLDGINWTEFQTPLQCTSFLGLALSGSTFITHGRNDCWGWGDGDDGVMGNTDWTSWQTFDIAGPYTSHGLAWANGRIVSVGATTPVSGEGAIYSSPEEAFTGQ